MASLRWFWHVLRSARGAGGVARGARPVEGTGRTAAPPDEPVTPAGPGGPRPRHIPAECDHCGGRPRPPAAATGAPFGDEWACPDCGRVRPDWPGIDWSPAELADTDMAPPPPAGPPGTGGGGAGLPGGARRVAGGAAGLDRGAAGRGAGRGGGRGTADPRGAVTGAGRPYPAAGEEGRGRGEAGPDRQGPEVAHGAGAGVHGRVPGAHGADPGRLRRAAAPLSRRRVRAPLVVAAAAGGAGGCRPCAPGRGVPGLQQRGSVVPVPPGRDRGGVARLQARGRDDEGEHEAGEQGEGHEERGGERQVGPPAVVCAPSLARRAARAGRAPHGRVTRRRHRAPVVGARGRDDGAGGLTGARPPAQPRTAGAPPAGAWAR